MSYGKRKFYRVIGTLYFIGVFGGISALFLFGFGSGFAEENPALGIIFNVIVINVLFLPIYAFFIIKGRRYYKKIKMQKALDEHAPEIPSEEGILICPVCKKVIDRESGICPICGRKI